MNQPIVSELCFKILNFICYYENDENYYELLLNLNIIEIFCEILFNSHNYVLKN